MVKKRLIAVLGTKNKFSIRYLKSEKSMVIYRKYATKLQNNLGNFRAHFEHTDCLNMMQ